jgi:tetratricopeptide (TPR) repeat protein
MLSGLFVCCASGPAPQRQSSEVRNQTRYLNKGVVMYAKGCYARALEHFSEAHERYSIADDLEGSANSLDSIANTYYHLDDIDSALLVYDDALELYSFLDDRAGMARVLINKATALIDARRLDEASGLLDEADNKAKGDMKALRIKTRALLALARDDTATARTLLKKALNAEDGDEPPVVSSIYYTQGYLELNADNPQKALQPLQTALKIDREANAYAGIAKDLQLLGQCHLQLGQDRRAVTNFKRSAKIHALLNNPHKVQAVVAQLEQAANAANVDIKATLHWINRWLAGEVASNLCR